jgi:AcrR family transcriptional regulator
MITQHEKTQIRQKQIISAARRLIVKCGSEHVTVKRMASEIGVSEGAIYRHFRSKSDVLSFLIDDIEETLINDIKKNESSKLDSLETLERIIINHLSTIEQREGVSFQVIAEIISLGDRNLNKKIHNVIDNYLSHIKIIFSKGINEGVISSDIDIDAVASMFFSITQGLVNIWALKQYKFDLIKEFRPIWEIFISAITKKNKLL